MARSSILIVMAALLSASAGAQETGAPLVRLPRQTAELPSVAVPEPKQHCENWTLAAALEAVLAAQHVPLSQEFWVLRIDLGEVCRNDPVDFAKLKKLVDGRYVLDDGRKVHLEMNFTPGPPTAPDAVIASLKLGHASLLFWRGHAYLLTGATFDEYIYPNGERMFEITELRLRDPGRSSTATDPVKFVKGRDHPDEIDGIIQIRVQEEKDMPWQR